MDKRTNGNPLENKNIYTYNNGQKGKQRTKN